MADAVAIAHVHVESWRTTYQGIVPDEYLAGLDETLRVQLWSEWLSGDTVVLVAEHAGVGGGICACGENPATSRNIRLRAIFALPP